MSFYSVINLATFDDYRQAMLDHNTDINIIVVNFYKLISFKPNYCCQL
jgi:hypothetical protein